jgi:hypothetical protein
VENGEIEKAVTELRDDLDDTLLSVIKDGLV